MTLAEALQIVDLDMIKLELRIADSETAHDSLLTGQIHDAANFVEKITGAKLADIPRSAVVAAVRTAYDGYAELRGTSVIYGWAEPFRKIAG